MGVNGVQEMVEGWGGSIKRLLDYFPKLCKFNVNIKIFDRYNVQDSRDKVLQYNSYQAVSSVAQPLRTSYSSHPAQDIDWSDHQ